MYLLVLEWVDGSHRFVLFIYLIFWLFSNVNVYLSISIVMQSCLCWRAPTRLHVELTNYLAAFMKNSDRKMVTNLNEIHAACLKADLQNYNFYC